MKKYKTRYSLKDIIEFEKVPEVIEQKLRTSRILAIGLILYCIVSIIPSMQKSYGHAVVTDFAIALIFVKALIHMQIVKNHVYPVVSTIYTLYFILFFHFIFESDWTIGMDAFWLFILIIPFVANYIVGAFYGTIASLGGFVLSIILLRTPLINLLQPYGSNMEQWYSVIYVVGMLTASVIAYELSANQLDKIASEKKVSYYQEERSKRLKEQLSIYETNEQAIRKYKHDLRHFSRVLMGYITEKDCESAEEYLKEFDTKLDEVTAVSFCDNRIVNEFLTIYSSRCQKKGFKLRAKANVPKIFPMEELDLTSLLANALENAIEAQEYVEPEKRSINVEIEYDGRKLRLRTKNPCAVETTFDEKGLPESTRPIKSGIGTQQIREVAEKYNGTASFNLEDGIFVVKAIMTCL